MLYNTTESLKNIFFIRPTVLMLVSKLIAFELVMLIIYSVITGPKFIFGDGINNNTLLAWTFGGFVFIYLSSIIQTIIVATLTLFWASEYFIVRSHDIVHRKGVFSTKEETYSLKNVEAFTVEQGIIGKLFHFGTVKFYSPVLKKDYFLANVPNPIELKDAIEQMVDQLKSLPQSGDKIIPVRK